MDERISIGQFSSLTWLSPKALRLYQAQGLLEPAWIDPDSGYRYYSPDQIPIAAIIGVLRRAGISLREISAHLDNPSADRVDGWRVALEAEFDERRRMLDHFTDTFPIPKEPTMTDPSAPVLTRAIPVLASLDIEATQRFYAEHLGFEPTAKYPDYGISSRGDVQIHFWLTDDADIPKATSCRIDVTGIDALYDEMLAAGVVHPNGPLRDQPWGLREFAVLDHDGNMIKFGQSL